MMFAVTLLLMTILSVLGLAFLSSRSNERQMAALDLDGTQAYQIALAGLESARVRVNNDLEFPPISDGEGAVLSFSENVYAPDQVTLAGHYTLTIESLWLNPPYQVLRITSVGSQVREGQVRARRKLCGEWDYHQARPTYRQLIHVLDLGGI